MYCSSCGSLNSDDGRFCIQCGLSLQGSQAPQPQSQPPISRRRRILKRVGIVFGCLLGLFVLLIILVAVFSDSSEDQLPGTARQVPSAPSLAAGTKSALRTTPAPSLTPTPIVVTANTLEREHEANEVSWEGEYVGKNAFITGSISSITDAGSEYDVKLNTDNLWVNIVCKISQSDRSSVLELATGETVTVYGLVTNDGIIDIIVKNCIIRSPQPSQAKDREQSPVASPGTTSGQGIAPTTTTLHPTATPDPFDQYHGAAKSAAAITVYVGTPTGSGSGFLHRNYDSGQFVILTNAHVVQDYSSVEVCWALIQKCTFEHVIDRGSEGFDVAVLEFVQFVEHGIDPEALKWFTSWYENNIAEFGEGKSKQWAKGDVVYASGYPGGHKIQGKDIISDPIVTEGIIATDRLASYRSAYFIEHGANIEPGSSGGPLIENASNVVGINTGTNLLTEQLELAIPMASVIQWLETGEEPSLTRTPRLLPDATPKVSTTPASTPTPVLAPTATPHPSPAPNVGTRTNPILLGSSVSYPEWNVSISAFTPDGNDLISSASPYNAPPDSEHVYVLVEVRGTYTGTGVGEMRHDLNYYLVGQSNRIYEIKVGILYDGLYRHVRVLQGGTASGTLAFMVPSNEVNSLLLIVADGSLQGRDATVGYFSLDASRVSG